MIRIATTNVADGNTSPFEYNDNTPEIAFLDARFSAILTTLVSDVDATYTHVNRLSKDYQDARFSPLYNLFTESLILAKKQPSLSSFKRRWMAYHRALLLADPSLEAFQYQKSKLDISASADRVVMKDTLAALVVFDYAMLLTLRELSTADIPAPARKTLRAFHESAVALRANKKQMIAEFLKHNNIDMFMLQELQGTPQEWNKVLRPHGYQIVMNAAKNTGIIIRKSKAFTRVTFPTSDTKLHDEILVLNIDDVYYISAHLNSKDAKKAGTPKNYEDQWTFLCKWIPAGAKYVIGIDANHHPSTIRGMREFPSDATISTTRKQRTSMQAQQHKIAKLDEGCKDHIITNYRIRGGQIRMLTDGGNVERLLPNAEHPCDHFISFATINTSK